MMKLPIKLHGNAKGRLAIAKLKPLSLLMSLFLHCQMRPLSLIREALKKIGIFLGIFP